jgi:hypothetical protein
MINAMRSAMMWWSNGIVSIHRRNTSATHCCYLLLLTVVLLCVDVGTILLLPIPHRCMAMLMVDGYALRINRALCNLTNTKQITNNQLPTNVCVACVVSWPVHCHYTTPTSTTVLADYWLYQFNVLMSQLIRSPMIIMLLLYSYSNGIIVYNLHNTKNI